MGGVVYVKVGYHAAWRADGAAADGSAMWPGPLRRPVSVPFQDVLLVVLVAYSAYSYWAGWSPRIPLYAALLTLGFAAVADWSGARGVANVLALDVVFFLGAALVLTALDRARPHRGSAGRSPAVADPPGTDPP
jgi:hypothetical protein